eukprot:s1188_g3.t2
MGKSLRTFKPPHNTTGTLIVWIQGGNNYAVQEHKTANHLKAKKFSAYVKEEICILYFYYYNESVEEPTSADSVQPAKTETSSGPMDIEKESKKRDGPETRTTVFEDSGRLDVQRHGGVFHVLHASGGKAKRVSYSTSHAETLSMVNGLEASTLIMIRLSELGHPERAPTLKQLIYIQENGNPELPIDFYGDCKDLWELVTGMRTLPQDKGQRLYVLGVKEARISGKIRQIVLVPTECMTSDALTKPLIHGSLLQLMTSGTVSFYNMPNHPVLSRVLPTLADYDEHDIIMTDDEVLDKIEKEETKNVKVSHASILLGLVAFGSYSTKALLAATMVQAAASYEIKNDEERTYVKNDEKVQNETYIGVYIMIFITVILAINLEKMVKYIYNKIHSKPKRLLPIKDEFPEGAAPMDVDKENLDMMEVDEDIAFEIRKMRKRLRKLETDKEELEVTLKVRQDALENIEERLLEKQTEAQQWLNYSQQVCDQLSTAQTEKRHAAEDRERYGNLLEQAKDDKEKFLTERNEFEDKYSVLQEKYDKLHEDHERQRSVIATSARQIAAYQEKERKARAEAEERNQRRDGGALFQQPAAPSEAEETLKRKVANLEANVARLQQLNGQYGQEIQNLRTQLAEKKAPARVFLTRSGSCYHEASCNHLKHGSEDRPKQEVKRQQAIVSAVQNTLHEVLETMSSQGGRAPGRQGSGAVLAVVDGTGEDFRNGLLPWELMMDLEVPQGALTHTLGDPKLMDSGAATRTVLQRDAVEWLEQLGPAGFPEKACVVTSLPDWSELKKGQKVSLKHYLDWFQKAVQLIFHCCQQGTLVIFLQTDIMTGGQWIDKASLICREADAAGQILLWHKITFDPDAVDLPRRSASADYSHLLCFIKSSSRSDGDCGRSAFDSRCSVPDLLPRGRKVYAQGMGTEVVIDPFCGRGTVLALANELGLAALGVDVDAACVKAAERLDILKLRAADTMHPVAYYLQRATDGRGKKSKQPKHVSEMKDTTSGDQKDGSISE